MQQLNIKLIRIWKFCPIENYHFSTPPQEAYEG